MGYKKDDPCLEKAFDSNKKNIRCIICDHEFIYHPDLVKETIIDGNKCAKICCPECDSINTQFISL